MYLFLVFCTSIKRLNVLFKYFEEVVSSHFSDGSLSVIIILLILFIVPQPLCLCAYHPKYK